MWVRAASNSMMSRSCIAFLTLFCLLLGTSPATADCDRPRSALSAMRGADLVFRGTVRDLRELRAEFRVSRRSSLVRTWGWVVSLDVGRVWKGAVGKQVTLHIAREGEDDAYDSFERGREYVVFANMNPPGKSGRFGVQRPTYGATGCGGTVSMLGASGYLLELGPGDPPK